MDSFKSEETRRDVESKSAIDNKLGFCIREMKDPQEWKISAVLYASVSLLCYFPVLLAFNSDSFGDVGIFNKAAFTPGLYRDVAVGLAVLLIPIILDASLDFLLGQDDDANPSFGFNIAEQ
jgi:hypothetical protein